MSTLVQAYGKILKRLKNLILLNVSWICLIYIVLSSDKLEVGNIEKAFVYVLALNFYEIILSKENGHLF